MPRVVALLDHLRGEGALAAGEGAVPLAQQGLQDVELDDAGAVVALGAVDRERLTADVVAHRHGRRPGPAAQVRRDRVRQGGLRAAAGSRGDDPAGGSVRLSQRPWCGGRGCRRARAPPCRPPGLRAPPGPDVPFASYRTVVRCPSVPPVGWPTSRVRGPGAFIRRPTAGPLRPEGAGGAAPARRGRPRPAGGLTPPRGRPGRAPPAGAEARPAGRRQRSRRGGGGDGAR